MSRSIVPPGRNDYGDFVRPVLAFFLTSMRLIACVGMIVMMAAVVSCRRTGLAPVAATTALDSVQRDNDEAARAVLATIAGKEQLPAGQVFENVKYLANTPARTLVGIMNGGYAKALGVRCSHCHVANDYASDDKRAKRAAREMQLMHRMINQQLAGMQNIQTPATANRAISCIVCHRGTAIPR
jgi:hypothetical protein